MQLIHVSKKYKNKIIFDDVSIKMPSRGLFFLKGESGIGKSTLLNIIYGIEKCKGKVYRFGSMGYMSQEWTLDDDKTVLDNLAPFGCCDDYLVRLNLIECKYKALKYLSLGEKRRVEFIATIMKRRDVYLIDEPFTNLDSGNKVLMLNILKELSQKSLVVVATHDMLDECDNFIEIKGKKLIFKCMNTSIGTYDSTKKSYLLNYIMINKWSLVFRNIVCGIIMIFAIYMSNYIKETNYENVVPLNVYVYESGDGFYTPTKQQLEPYLNDWSKVRGFVEPMFANEMDLYVKGNEVDDFDVIFVIDESVMINDVFVELYKDLNLYIFIEGDYIEEKVEAVVYDSYIRPTIYLPYDKYEKYCDEYVGVVIDDPKEGNGVLTKVEVYPQIPDEVNKSIRKMEKGSKIAVIIGVFSLWVIIVIFLFEFNMKVYRNIRLNLSSKDFLIYLIFERLFMLVLIFCMPMRLYWLFLWLGELFISCIYLDKKIGEIKKV